MFDFFAWVLTAAMAVLATPWLAESAEPDVPELFARTLAPSMLPLVASFFINENASGHARLRDRVLASWTYFAPLTTLAALAFGGLPAFLAARFPDLPSSVAIAASSFVGFGCVIATLAGEHHAFRRDHRFEPPPISPRLRVAVCVLGFPILLTAAADLLRCLPVLRIYYDSYVVWQLAAFGGAALFLLWALPFAVRLAVATRKLERGPLHEAFDGVARAMGVRVKQYLVVLTQGRVSNAALLGGTGPRTVLLTDRLIAEHPLPELVAIVGHELGHARARHMTLFSLLVAAPAIWVLCVPDSWWMQWNSAVPWAVGGGLVFLYFRFVFGPVARICELEADIQGAAVAGSDEPIRLSLERICGFDGRSRTSWRHPSVEARASFLRAAAADPAVAQRPRRILGRVRVVAAVAAFAGAALFLTERVEALPRERVAAALRAGAYDRALAVARAHPGKAMEPWRRLAELAAGTGMAGPETVRDRARAAFARRDFEKAAQLANVVALRTGRASDALLTAVADAVQQDDLDAAFQLLAGPASFLRRDPFVAAVVSEIQEKAASRAGRAPGTGSRPVGT